MTNCNEINIEAERLKSIFGKCYNLKALDLRDVVDLIESVNACSNGKFELKTINGKSLFGSGNIIVTADVDGTETKIQQGSGILISGSGSIGSPYVITSKVDPADGSETKIKQGSNISIGGTGTSSDPYVINAIMPSSEAQVNPDWSAISGPAKILNKPEIPLAQVNADWNAVSGVTRILNKPNTLNTNLGYVQSEFGGEITSSNGTSATIPLVSDEFPGLVSKEMLDALGNDLNNIKLEFEISMPANETNEGFATSINTREFIEITGNQIPTFKAIKIDGEDSKIFYVEILGRGKGGYGVDGYQLSSEEVRFTSFNLTGGNIEDLPGTQIIDLGINSTDVVSVINSRIPNLIIQGQEDGYVLIKGTFNGTVYREYLWIGEGGIYGGEIGASQASYSNLKELTIESVGRATSTSSGTVKTNLTVEDPVVYLKETSDLLLNEKEDKANKQNSLTVDGTGIKYPTVDSVVGGLATKANISGQIFTGAISATNISGTNTGDETTLSIQTKRPLKTLDGVSIEGVGDTIIPTKAHALTHELGGTDVIQGENLSVNVIPPTNNYSPVTSTLKGHLQGIDQTLGSVQPTLVSGTTIKTIEGQSILGSGNIDITKSDVGLPLADNTSDASKSVLSSTKLTTPRSINGVNFDGTSNITINAVDSTPRIAVSEKAQANGVATLGSDGKVPNNQIPALAISETFPVSSQAAMLALTAADQGDIAIRSDINKSFILRVSPSSVLSNWSELLTPTSAVTSVAGKVGVVTLNTSDVGGLQTALNSKANDSDVVHIAGDEIITGSKVFTGIPSAPTATIGTNTTQIATTAFVTGAVFDGLATKANDSDVVHTAGYEVITGSKVFTGKIDMQTFDASSALTVSTLGSNGASAATFINSSSFPNVSALRLTTSTSGGVGNMALNVSNKSHIGTGIFSNASNGGVSISSQSGNGDSYISNITFGGTGRNYVGRNNGTETYSVDKTGNVIGNSYIKRSTPANNILLAGGGDLAQGTAFNKNFGTTSGTVAEGNDSRFTDARIPLPNSSNYIQNQNSSAQSANMWISGTGQFGDKVMFSELDPTIGGKIYGYNDSSIDVYGGGLKFQTRYYDGTSYVFTDRLTIGSSGAATFTSKVSTVGYASVIESNGGFNAVSSNVNLDNVSFKIMNSAASKVYAFTAGTQGVSHDGFGLWNVTDNTHPVWVEPSGDVSLNSNTTVSGTVTATSFNGSATLTGTPTAPTAPVGTNTEQIATTAFVAGGLATKENAFSKNTAFNKNFGTTAGTVSEGNDSRILNGQTAFSWGNHAGLYPSLTGTGATGTWPISVSGNAGAAALWGGRGADLNAVQDSEFDHVLTRGGDGIARLTSPAGIKSWLGLGSNAYSSTAFAPLNGTGANGTWGINISGNSSSATSWGGRTADFVTAFGNQPFNLYGLDNPSGIAKPFNDSQIKSWLGLGSNAYSSTAYLPLSGGAVTGNLNVTGNVGIGTATPSRKFDIVVSTNSSTDVFGFSNSISGGLFGVDEINKYVYLKLNTGSGYGMDFRNYLGNSSLKFSDLGAATFSSSVTTKSKIRSVYADLALESYINTTTGHAYIDSVKDDAGYNMYFRMRTNGTPIYALSFIGTGAATFASTVTASSFNGSATLTGTPTAPTAVPGTNTTQIATTAFVQAGLNLKVDKVAGKSLISDTEITRLATVTNQDISGKFDKTGGTISGNVNVTGTVTASPATASNHLVTKAQLDAAENIIGSSDRFYANPLANMINVDSFAIRLATYIRVGNMVTAQVEFTITPIASGLVAFDFNLPFARGVNAIDAMGHGTGKLLGYIIPVSVSSSTTHSAKVEMFTPNIHEIKISATIQYDVTF